MSFKSTLSKSALWSAIGAASVALVAVNANAAEPAPQIRVFYEDLNLAMQKDAEMLYSRLQMASKRVCSDFGRELQHRRQQRECYERALSNAVADVDHAAVTALHSSDRNIRLAQRKSADPRSS